MTEWQFHAAFPSHYVAILRLMHGYYNNCMNWYSYSYLILSYSIAVASYSASQQHMCYDAINTCL